MEVTINKVSSTVGIEGEGGAGNFEGLLQRVLDAIIEAAQDEQRNRRPRDGAPSERGQATTRQRLKSLSITVVVDVDD